jgi:hypothetical protein
MTSVDDGRQRRRARLRRGFLAAAVATALVSLACGGSPAGASVAPGRAAAGGGGYLYWSNTIGSITKPGNGTRVVARVDVTAMQPRVLPGDRQAQAAALRTRPRRVGLEERSNTCSRENTCRGEPDRTSSSLSSVGVSKTSRPPRWTISELRSIMSSP